MTSAAAIPAMALPAAFPPPTNGGCEREDGFFGVATRVCGESEGLS